MVQSALRFIKFRKRRFIEQVPSLRKFLSDIFAECQRRYKEFVRNKFRHRTYGEFKKKKEETKIRGSPERKSKRQQQEEEKSKLLECNLLVTPLYYRQVVPHVFQTTLLLHSETDHKIKEP